MKMAARIVWGLAASTAALVAIAGPEIEIIAPPAGQPLFGRHEIRVAVGSAELAELDELTIVVDSRPVATLRAPPFRATADFGEENRPHRIEVVVRRRSGSTVRAVRDVPPIRVDDRIELDLKQLYVTATLRGHRRVLDLDAEDFTVDDDGTRQEIVTFERGDIPFTAVLLLDGSRSMRGRRLDAALAGARAFVAGMRAFDEARLLVSADRLLEVSPFVSRGEPLAEALEGTAATGGTALYDHLFLALKTLERRQGRRVVVLLSDGYDVHSVVGLAQIRELVRHGEAMIYWLRPRETAGEREAVVPRTSWRHHRRAEEDYRQLLRAVRDTGGRILDVSRTEETGPALQEILAELREQYAIGYYPTRRRSDGSLRRVSVKVRRPGVRLRYRTEYVDR